MSGSAGLSTLPTLLHGCPLQAAEDALLLLATGRPDMARAVLERLPGLVRDALAPPATERARAAATAEVARLRAEARALETRLALTRREVAEADAALARRRRALERDAVVAPAIPRRPKRHETLALALSSGRVTAGEVARLLGGTPADVERIAAGKVGLAGSAWKRLLGAIGAGPVEDPAPVTDRAVR